GMPDFMACEVELQQYLFLTAVPIPMSQTPSVLPLAQLPFRANSLHDLESLWWILMWVIHYHVDKCSPTLAPGHKTLYQKHFPGPNCTLGQTRLMSLMLDVENPSLPIAFAQAIQMANNFCLMLRQSYEYTELNQVVEVDQLYKSCSTHLTEDLSVVLSDQDVDLVPLHDLKKCKTAPEPVEGNAGTQQPMK
ncbi:hypothetical protein PAXRUDRAFT_154886, partial [Paxillus rubicundulus Ve08.2h10]